MCFMFRTNLYNQKYNPIRRSHYVEIVAAVCMFMFVALLMPANVHAASAQAGAAPAEVRIAASSFYENGKSSVRGTPAVNYIINDGWLERELTARGIKLSWFPIVPGDTGASVNEAFASNRIDFGNYGDLPSISLNAGGVRTQVVAAIGRGSDTYLVVPTNSTAKSIVDLKGKSISIHRGRPWELGLLHLLDANGLSYSDFKIYNINPPAGAAALAAGRIDALYTNNPFLLEDQGVARILWSTKDAPLDWKMRAELWASTPFTEQYPEVTQLVVTAYIKAAYWLAQEQNREQVIQIGTRNGTPESAIRRQYDDHNLTWKQRWTPLFDDLVYTHYRHAVTFAVKNRLVRKQINADELLQPRFTEAALKQLQLQDYWANPAPAPAQHLTSTN